MKHIVTLLLVPALATVAIAQKKEVRYPSLPMDDKSKVVNYNEVVEVGGATAKDLYARFMEWGKGYHNGFAGKLRKNDEANGAVEVFANMRYYAHDAKGAKTTSLIGVIQYTMFSLVPAIGSFDNPLPSGLQALDQFSMLHKLYSFLSSLAALLSLAMMILHMYANRGNVPKDE